MGVFVVVWKEGFGWCGGCLVFRFLGGSRLTEVADFRVVRRLPGVDVFLGD